MNCTAVELSCMSNQRPNCRPMVSELLSRTRFRPQNYFNTMSIVANVSVLVSVQSGVNQLVTGALLRAMTDNSQVWRCCYLYWLVLRANEKRASLKFNSFWCKQFVASITQWRSKLWSVRVATCNTAFCMHCVNRTYRLKAWQTDTHWFTAPPAPSLHIQLTNRIYTHSGKSKNVAALAKRYVTDTTRLPNWNKKVQWKAFSWDTFSNSMILSQSMKWESRK